ncbi:TetR/AcrR family transcriptional regulator [Streptomyces clavuligerus]|nr:TetR/AcrR family transcriptional regulator [Streptomyces clavuligerus]MBY6305787.1 helix-turn-helix transcriptional regulator [Streptomyces clavuligerus]QPL65663.1 helix-turn-helix transcriptional regulator [Streptomyces clavuligerus]QPL72233.1 helix-turn-helix transcriptional regulator [Streptomyces clavuligerus]QPL77776.1 helix-turn-helix transcriptional regulator [Streptomyces clavuligerus]QPL83802.1 helix-turn-helix transcriptional regulator [Streptomyces clavuligerus]
MTIDRERVLRAAAALLARKSTATMDEVAKAAGIGRATLHRHFAGRDALVRALEEFGLRELEAAVEEARPDEGSAPEALRRLIGATAPASPLLGFLITENQLFEGEGVNEGWARIDAVCTTLFRRGQEEGHFRVDLTAVWLTEALYGLLSAGAWAVQAGRVAPKDYQYMIAELVLGGCVRRSVEA